MKDKVILVCSRVIMGEPLLMHDNLTGRCAACGHTVQYRPHAPKPHELRCIECYAALARPDEEHFTTTRMIEDAEAYFRRKKY